MKFSAENPHLRVASKRCGLYGSSKAELKTKKLQLVKQLKLKINLKFKQL